MWSSAPLQVEATQIISKLIDHKPLHIRPAIAVIAVLGTVIIRTQATSHLHLALAVRAIRAVPAPRMLLLAPAVRALVTAASLVRSHGRGDAFFVVVLVVFVVVFILSTMAVVAEFAVLIFAGAAILAASVTGVAVVAFAIVAF